MWNCFGEYVANSEFRTLCDTLNPIGDERLENLVNLLLSEAVQAASANPKV